MRIKGFLSLFFAILATGFGSPGAPQGPITAKQLLAWVIGAMSPDHLSDLVDRRGLGFQPDDSYLAIIKSAGATPFSLTIHWGTCCPPPMR